MRVQAHTRMAVSNLTLFEWAGILRADDADAAKPPEVVLQRLHGSRPRTVWELGAGAGDPKARLRF